MKKWIEQIKAKSPSKTKHQMIRQRAYSVAGAWRKYLRTDNPADLRAMHNHLAGMLTFILGKDFSLQEEESQWEIEIEKERR